MKEGKETERDQFCQNVWVFRGLGFGKLLDFTFYKAWKIIECLSFFFPFFFVSLQKKRNE